MEMTGDRRLSSGKKFLFLFLLAAHTALCPAQTARSFIPNPVLPGVADAGVLKFNGEYYIGGVSTNGALYHSADLVHWEGPDTVFVMNNQWATPYGIGGEQIHSNDLNYVNGQFHLYWNVNYWSKDRNIIHIGHAVSSDIKGPFVEPEKNTWFDSRLDPKLFVDDDGSLYFYSVKFSDGNTIWGRRMKDAEHFAGKPVYMFASLPNTWETMDNRVAEGPWVMKYRGKYYMMYNANHTSPAWGNYALGVAEADGPLLFNHGNKYPHPVVQSNQVDLEELHPDLLKYQKNDGALVRYTFEKPAGNWQQANFNDSGWSKGISGFGSQIIEGSTTRKIGTTWRQPEIWTRKTFDVPGGGQHHFALRVHHDGATKIFLNGTLIYENAAANYQVIYPDSAVSKLFKTTGNILAAQSSGGNGSAYLDISIFDVNRNSSDNILFTPGQPNIIKGPNGFEWWLVYMANKNNERRGQFINRVFFWNRKLTVDGITDQNTAGYHPCPAGAGFSDLFSDPENIDSRWTRKKGTWKIDNGELAGGNDSEIYLNDKLQSDYLFEISVKLKPESSAGVYAWWKDAGNWVKVEIDQQSKCWFMKTCSRGELNSRSYALPPAFNFSVYHKISVYKNNGAFTIKIDDLPAPGKAVFATSFSSAGVVGLYAGARGASFDGALHTAGWDEYGKEMRGWHDERGTPAPASDSGISSPSGGDWNVWKGDRLQQYELSVQITAADACGSAGAYPVYVDPDNYMKCVFDYAAKKIILSGKLKGKTLSQEERNVDTLTSCFAGIAESDFMETHFDLDGKTCIDGLRLDRRAGDSLTRVADRIDISYRLGNKWLALPHSQQEVSDHPGFEILRFDPVWAEEIRCTGKDASGRQPAVRKLWVEEKFRQSFNLRTVKSGGMVRIFVNNRLLFLTKDDFPASAVGLCASKARAHFNGITLFEIP